MTDLSIIIYCIYYQPGLHSRISKYEQEKAVEQANVSIPVIAKAKAKEIPLQLDGARPTASFQTLCSRSPLHLAKKTFAMLLILLQRAEEDARV